MKLYITYTIIFWIITALQVIVYSTLLAYLLYNMGAQVHLAEYHIIQRTNLKC